MKTSFKALAFIAAITLSQATWAANSCIYSLALNGATEDIAFIFTDHEAQMASRGYHSQGPGSLYQIDINLKYTTVTGENITQELRSDPLAAGLLYSQGYISLNGRVLDVTSGKSQYFAAQSGAIDLPSLMQDYFSNLNSDRTGVYKSTLDELKNRLFLQILKCQDQIE